MDKIEFPEKIRSLREAALLTQKQLALQIGVTPTTVSHYEAGRKFPSLDVLIKLANVFHVSLDYLVGIEHSLSVNLDGLSEADSTVVFAVINALREKESF